MDNQYQQQLQSICIFKKFKKNQTVFNQGDRAKAIFKVVEGEVHLYRFSPGGKRTLLYRASKNSFFAEASLSSDVYHCTAVCVKQSEVQIIDSDKLGKLLNQDSNFAFMWISILSLELIRQRASVERLNIKSAADRIRHYIMTEGDASGDLQLQGSLSDLSELLGLSRESLYRTLSTMEKSGDLVRSEQSLKLL
jgi:CRP-like cAMP-binding protein